AGASGAVAATRLAQAGFRVVVLEQGDWPDYAKARAAFPDFELGWHWWPGPNAIATRPYGRLHACTQRATCLWGCAEGAKATVDRTYWPVAVDRGVTLVTRARVKRLLRGRDGLVEGALYTDAEGRE